MKIKTNKAAAKRLKRTASGKVKHKGAFGRHLMKTKNAKRLRRIKKTRHVHPSYADHMERLLPNF